MEGRRLPLPWVPPGYTLSKFGGEVVKWGNSSEAARARMESLTEQDLESMRSLGLTRARADEWRDFYTDVSRRNPQNPSAAGRVDLMQRIADLLDRTW